MEINIYCDESCHLEHDQKDYMVLGAIWLPKDQVKRISLAISNIKNKYRIANNYEIKWTNVSGSSALLPFYYELIDLFFTDPSLHFRALIINKKNLNHSAYNQTHDIWYYKMYFRLISNILDASDTYNIYLDIKDTRSNTKAQKLKEVLNNDKYSFNRSIIQKVQHVISKEVKQVQMSDLLIGALQYKYNTLLNHTSNITPKGKLVKYIENYHKDLTRNTLPSEKKFNIFHWSGY